MIAGLEQIVQRHGRQLARFGILLAALCALPALGYLSRRLPLSLLLLVLLAVLGVVVLIQRLELGLFAILLAGVFVEYSLPTGTSSRIGFGLVISVACVGLWILRMAVLDKRLTIISAPTNRPLLAFIATVAISWFWGYAFRDPLVVELGHPLVSVAAGIVMMLLPACYLLAANTISSIRWLEALVWALLAAGLPVVVLDLGAWFGLAPAEALLRFIGQNRLVDLNSHGLLSMWCLAFSLALTLFSSRLSIATRGVLLLYALAWAYWGYPVHATWLSGWVPAYLVALVIVFLRSKRLFLVLVTVVLLVVGQDYYATHLQAETEISGLTRLQAYSVNWRITGKHLLFGTGPAGYASYYMSYFPDEAMATHSNYVDIVAQTGIAGSVFFLWFLGAQACGSYRMRRALQGRGDLAESLAVAVVAGTVGCAVAMALGDWLFPFAYTQSISGFDLAVISWVFMGTIWGLSQQAVLDGATSATRSCAPETAT